MAIDPSKIAKAIRAAQAAKKKIAKVSAGQARSVAKEQMKNAGKRPGRKINKRTGLTPEEASTSRIKQPVKKSNFGRGRSPEDVIRGRIISREQIRKSFAKPPAKRGTSRRGPVQVTRGPSIAKRSEVEEVMSKRLQKQVRREKAAEMLKKMDPADRKRFEARAQVKRAMREEAAGKTKYGMDIKSPRERLDERVIERVKELTAQEKNAIARKEAIEFGQRREADRRAAEGLKARDKNIRDRMKKMSPEQKRKYLNYLKESGW